MKHLKLPITILVALLTFSAFAGLETFTGKYIADLVATNPVGGTDPQSEGDDHIRGIKLVLQNTFANVNGAVTSTDEELNYVDVATLGTVETSGAWTADSSGNTTTPYDLTVAGDTTLGDAAGDTITFTGTPTFSTTATFSATTPGIDLSNATPMIYFSESGVGTDQGKWRLIADGEAYVFSVLDDSISYTKDVMTIQRSGTGASMQVDSIKFVADALQFGDSGDSSKIVALDVDGASATTTTTLDFNQTANRTITFPNATDTLVGRDTTDTLTNKTLTSPDINGGTLDNAPVGASTASTGAFTTLNASGATTLDGNVTLGNAAADLVTVTGTVQGASPLVFEGGAADANELTLAIASLSGDVTVTLPAATDTLVGKATTDTFTNKTFDANGTGNSLSNVDVADLANGTDGNLITWDAAGAPAVVATGTAGQVLTSNGAGAAPTFQQGITGTGSAPYYAARAWVNFTGNGATGAATINASGNVASVTKNSTGNYTITFTTAMSDANYVVSGSGSSATGAGYNLSVSLNNVAAGSFDMLTGWEDAGALASDCVVCTVMVVR